ncbi:CDP-diacylglycerol--serine O-phosphatidyltransferase [Alicyclobacillus tolerans]|uniref:CDP-diacylglycerol--serine O-phosphatidyltransferase n=1 Tax=Alicyclobacillus tolerans TaxID=90970 RepID=UPI001EFF7FE7|nr:CDP-diacylglycerol--serine O-phosphatidyltransferase [Alicyclobacillus tolerans]MCF8566036.1 CDP-diacylglycerol--serine O-phosphatidyltransferase [Alicyclobacillus tolerans]
MWTKAIPSLLTISNLIIGVVSLLLASRGFASDAALLVVIGMALDGLDGRAARYFKAESEFGKELDSLSDIITFGVAPSVIMYNVVLQYEGWVGMAVAVLFPLAGALRLARFNIQKTSTKYFIGLPITAAGGILATMALYRNLLSPAAVILPVGMLILSVLMVSQVRYPNFKKIAFPRSAIVVVPILAVLVYIVFRFEQDSARRLIFVPLALYALYGMGRAVRKKARRNPDGESQKVFKSSIK